MNQVLSTRCDPIILKQIKQEAKIENTSLRVVIERAWKFYQTEQMRKQIIDSYSTLDTDDVAIAEEDINQYFYNVLDGNE